MFLMRGTHTPCGRLRITTTNQPNRKRSRRCRRCRCRRRSCPSTRSGEESFLQLRGKHANVSCDRCQSREHTKPRARARGPRPRQRRRQRRQRRRPHRVWFVMLLGADADADAAAAAADDGSPQYPLNVYSCSRDSMCVSVHPGRSAKCSLLRTSYSMHLRTRTWASGSPRTHVRRVRAAVAVVVVELTCWMAHSGSR